MPPSRWYVTGFLVPSEAPVEEDDPTEDDDEVGGGDADDDADTHAPEPSSKRRGRLPSSMGMSVLLSAQAAEDVFATVQWADYAPLEETGEEKAATARRRDWSRIPRPAARLSIPLDAAKLQEGVPVPGSDGLVLQGHLALAEAHGLPPGTRALSLFLVNRRIPLTGVLRDAAYAFQVRLSLRCESGLVDRSNRRDEASKEWDARVADLHFRDVCEYAVGHGVSVAPAPAEGGLVRGASTTWLPQTLVHRVVPREVPGVVVEMETLAELTDGAAARVALSPLVEEYGNWLSGQRAKPLDTEFRKNTRKELLDQAERARMRIRDGIELLATDTQALESFRLANRAMAEVSRRTRPTDTPRWRLFQLAFVLLNLPSVHDERHADRETVELIFFPTGGGKTEAYLGLIAFLLLHRRLSAVDRPDAGLGVTVLLRYTLRLLTLDQLGRAATLICALELLRRRDERLGQVRFSIGLWVGRSATANTLEDVKKRIAEYKSNTSKNAASPCPLTQCPWCATELDRDSFVLEPAQKPHSVLVGCRKRDCEFNLGMNREGVPVVFVDEQVYSELPAFLLATVDKFALLPWRGETGKLFGRVHSRAGRRFFGPSDSETAAGAVPLAQGLRPPELIVQDELHLISGPLGSMVGLYETAIDALCTRVLDGGMAVRPKVLASTATVRRAREQILALFGRPDTAIFPPHGVDDSETFFAQVDKSGGARKYVGVAAPGRPMKAILLRLYIAALAAAFRHSGPKEGTPSEATDPYLTLVGYFNTLRELGGMRRLVEDEVRQRLLNWGRERKPSNWTGPNPWFADRKIAGEPIELTSRESTSSISRAKARLSKLHGETDSVDVVLASNMISVGVDINRLGLMVIAGQPKTTSEYIQASSRVGRRAEKPGLVFTCLNVGRPRDRSHYERFGAYHASFYRFVEATSVTPFSAPALERGLAGVLVGLSRLRDPSLTPSSAVMGIEASRQLAEAAVQVIAQRAARAQDLREQEDLERVERELLQRGRNLVDAWCSIVRRAREDAARRSYSSLDVQRSGKPLLHAPLEDEELDSDEQKFAAPLSMRDVEPSVHLWLERRNLGGKKVI